MATPLSSSVGTPQPLQLFLEAEASQERQRLAALSGQVPAFRQAVAEWRAVTPSQLSTMLEEVRAMTPDGGWSVHLHLAQQALLHLLDEPDGEGERGDFCRQSLLAISGHPLWDWIEDDHGPLGLLQTSHIILAAAVALELAPDLLSPAELHAFRDALAEVGAARLARTVQALLEEEWTSWKPILALHPHRQPASMERWGYIGGRCNFICVTSAGLGLAALMLRDSRPEAESWLALAKRGTLAAFSRLFQPDGSHGEGLGYASYALQCLLHFLEPLSRLGEADALWAAFDWRRALEFILCLHADWRSNGSLQRGAVGFGDGALSSGSALPLALGRRFRDGLAQWCGLERSGNHSALSLLWFDSTVEATPPPPWLRARRFALDWVVWRTGWEADDLLFAFRSGPPSNHEHGDRHSFLLHAFGERLVHDPVGVTYHRNDPDWVLRTSAGHNTLLIDDRGTRYHDGRHGTNASEDVARIIHYQVGEVAHYLVSDATPAYQLLHLDVERVLRSVLHIHPDLILLVDQVEKRAVGSAYAWRFHADDTDGQATLSARADGFTIARPLARLEAWSASHLPLKVSAGAWKLPNRPSSDPYIEIATRERSRHVILITLLAALRSGAAAPTVAIQPHIGGWSVDVGGEARHVHIELTTEGEYPRPSLHLSGRAGEQCWSI